MNILTIDVTSAKLVVACSKGEEIKFKISQESGKKHNALIMPYIEEILIEQNLDINDIDVFSCVVGPGSFTGIRIGIATMKALSFATNKKTIAINALEELAYKKDGHFITAIDALHGNYYYAEFDNSFLNVKEMGCKDINEIKNKNLEIVYKDKECDPYKLIEITTIKANEGLYQTLEPVYLRKSQAERDLDGE